MDLYLIPSVNKHSRSADILTNYKEKLRIK